MNRLQWIAVAVALLNVVLVLLFPPFDYISAARNNVPTFDGFYWVFGGHGSRVTNSNFLQLELFVIVINAAIAWLLLKERPVAGRQERAAVTAPAGAPSRRVNWQKVVMAGVALNLLLVVLFPPMENYYSVTRAALPSFDGFYFLFGSYGARSIVIQLLYIEVFFVLANGGILWLLFKKSGQMTDKQRAALMRELQRRK